MPGCEIRSALRFRKEIMTVVSATDRNPLLEQADAIALTLDRDGRCTSDLAPDIVKRIQRLYGREIQKRLPLEDGDILVLDNPAVRPVYHSVIFVVDSVERPLAAIFHFVLHEAELRHMQKVTLPTSRTGILARKKPREEPLGEMVRSMENFIRHRPSYLQEIRVVFRDDVTGPDRLARLLKAQDG